MSAQTLLDRLDKVASTGRGRWVARCPSHADKHPSLAVLEKDDGRVLVHCFAGCAVQEVLDSAGVAMTDLFPPRPIRVEGARSERRPWMPTDVFEVVRFEISIAALIAADLHKGRSVSEQDYRRLHVVVNRLEHVASAAYGH